MATEQTVWIFKVIQTRTGGFIAAIDNKAIGLQQAGGAHELVGVPPERRAGRRAASTQNALVQAVELVAGFRALQTPFLGRRLIIDQERLARMILFGIGRASCRE